MKKIYKIPVEWAVCSFAEIEAETVEEAIDIFNNIKDDMPLPSPQEYIDGSFQMTQHNEPDDVFVKIFND